MDMVAVGGSRASRGVDGGHGGSNLLLWVKEEEDAGPIVLLVSVNDTIPVETEPEPVPEPENPIDTAMRLSALKACHEKHILREYNPTLTDDEEQRQFAAPARESDPSAYFNGLSKEEEEHDDSD